MGHVISAVGNFDEFMGIGMELLREVKGAVSKFEGRGEKISFQVAVGVKS